MPLFPVYPLFDIDIVKGRGCRVWDAEGQEYLDLFPNGKARTLVSNCMNKAKADLPAQK